MTARHQLVYHGAGYAVKLRNVVVFEHLDLRAAVEKAQELNGWIIDGNGDTFAKQAADHDKANRLDKARVSLA